MVSSRNHLLGMAALLAASAVGQYTLVDNYDINNFFTEGFSFFSQPDPTHGFVRYATAQAASDRLLAGYAQGAVYLGVDHKTAPEEINGGRGSTRVTSTKAYTKGLFVADIAHMPVGCGVWPAFWTVGPQWPSSGEIDILEGVNSATTTQYTLHAGSGCRVEATGPLEESDCNADEGKKGCGVKSTDPQTFGTGFNAIGGGVYIAEWTSEAISIWFFPRGSPQATALAAHNDTAGPDVASFGPPATRFTGCDFDAHFKQHNLVFNTALCGDWAGNQQVWQADETCSKLAPTCQDYVTANPGAFTQAYWLVNRVAVFQQGAAPEAGAGAQGRKGRRFVA